MPVTRRSFLALLSSALAAPALSKIPGGEAIAEPLKIVPEDIKYFDVVTYTGNGGAQMIQYNLGMPADLVMIKKARGAGAEWIIEKMKRTENTEFRDHPFFAIDPSAEKSVHTTPKVIVVDGKTHLVNVVDHDEEK